MKMLLSFISFFLTYAASAQQQQYRFLQFGVKEGLSQNSVHCIFRDRDGLVWIGTQDGLNSFDGKKFTVYKPRENDSTSISDQFILAIKEDMDGYLWIGTRHGLNRLDKRTGKFIRFFANEAEKQEFQASYNDFICTPEGNIIFDRINSINVLSASGSVQRYMTPPGSGFLATDDHHKLWFFSNEKGVFYSETTNKPALKPVATPFNDILPADNSSYLEWIPGFHIFCSRGVTNNIYFFDDLNKKWLPPLTIPASVSSVIQSRNGLLYFATQKGIYVVNNFTITGLIQNIPGHPGSLPPGNILSLYEDKTGNLWVGTAGAGFLLYSPSFNNFKMAPTPVENDVVNAIAKKGTSLWAGSSTGLYKLNKDANSLLPAGISGKKITAITIDNKDNIWIGVDREGLWQLNTNGRLLEKYEPTNSPLQSDQVLHLSFDGKDNVFASTEKYFYVINTTTRKWKTITCEINDHISGAYTLHSYKDSQAFIWLSTNYGVIKYDSLFNRVNALASNNDSSAIKRTLITSVTQDEKGIVWISTISKGIYAYHDDKLTHFSFTNGLASDVVYGLVTDNQNRIWATTSNGLHLYDERLNRFFRLSAFDGLPQTSFSIGSMIRAADSNIYIGTSNGLLICKADAVSTNSKPLRAKITDVKINGESIESLGQDLTIKPDNKTISFEFGTSEAFQLGNVIYQYKLAGADKDWITLPPEINKVTYNNLPYKKSILYLRAASSLNELDNAPVYSFNIYSRPPFYKASWFLFLSGILLIAVIAWLIQSYNKRKYQHKLQQLQTQKELQQERERIGRDLHDNIGAYTSALIAGLNRVKPTDSSDLEHITDLKEYADNIMGYLRETIWVLHHQSLTITAFADRFKNYAYKISKNYPGTELKINESITDDKELPPQIMLNLFRIMQEALQNAYKHSHAKNIDISFLQNNKTIFSVSDDGKGIDAGEKEEHYGLKNMQQRAKEIGFELLIKSNRDRGTMVTITEQ